MSAIIVIFFCLVGFVIGALMGDATHEVDRLLPHFILVLMPAFYSYYLLFGFLMSHIKIEWVAS